MIMMSIQYVVVRIAIAQNLWRWINSSLKKSNVIESCNNIALLRILPDCLHSVRHPVSKEKYKDLGRKQGLRVTHNIIDRPASGLCFGISLRFLAEFAAKGDIRTAAKTISGGADLISVRIQALYDALLGIQGTVKSKNQELSDIIQLFMKNPIKPLREFVLDDLEAKGVEITPDLYAQILEADACWHHKNHPKEEKYSSVHNAVRQAVANSVGLDLVSSDHFEGTLSSVKDQIQQLKNGLYLIEFPHHILPFIKGDAFAAIGDPTEGVSQFPSTELEANIMQMLSFYSSDDHVSLHVLSIQDIHTK